ncbi:hypothetical protein HMSSN036_23340 [Paenibacillus macerans]|nr:hypothetical protein HMSSN036_23340 [Paenibacillus macerans]
MKNSKDGRRLGELTTNTGWVKRNSGLFYNTGRLSKRLVKTYKSAGKTYAVEVRVPAVYTGHLSMENS